MAMDSQDPANQTPDPGQPSASGSSDDVTISTRQEQASQPVASGAVPVSASLNRSDEMTPTPTFIGRYRVERLLGAGTFGRVYLAHDDQLQRQVAIKIPRLGDALSTTVPTSVGRGGVEA